MGRWMAAGLVLSCALCGPPRTAAAAEVPARPVSVQQEALALLDALRAGELERAAQRLVDFVAWQRISKRALDPAAHRRRHRALLRQLAGAFAQGAAVERLELADVLLLPAGPKRKRAVVMAVFHLALRLPGRPADEPLLVPLLWLQLDGGWRLMVRA